MPNVIKYSVTTETQALRSGNFYLGVGDVGKGPTESSGYWNGISPPVSGYTVYLNKATQGPSIYTPNNDSDLITITNMIGGTSFTSVTQCFNWYNTQNDKMVVNKDYPAIVTDGLVLNLDASFRPSYSGSGATWYDISVSGNTGTLINGPTYNSGGWITFDGTDDYMTLPDNDNWFYSNKDFSIEFWYNFNTIPDSTGQYFYSQRVSGGNYIFIFATDTKWEFDSYSNNIQGPKISYLKTHVTDKWDFISLTRIGDNFNLYENANIVGSQVNSFILPNLNAPLEFGRWTGGPSRYINAKISSLKIYNGKGLTITEVKQNFDNTKSQFIPLEVQYLIVAGGGSGGAGSYPSGGGGAGGLLTGMTSSFITNTNYSVIVGAGGSSASNGSNSKFSSFISIGGGKGGNGGQSGNLGQNGGSGGGGGSNYPYTPNYLTPAGSGTIGQGFDGGVGKSVYGDTRLSGTPTGGGGGGGAGQVGGTGTTTPSIKAGNGGNGLYFSEYTSIGGSPVGWFAGGGGGSTSYSNSSPAAVGIGGSGGGGNGSYTSFTATPIGGQGIVNTGGGGGGAGYQQFTSANGGSGIIILRIPGAYSANFSSGVSHTVTNSGNYKYYKITATSTTSEVVSFS